MIIHRLYVLILLCLVAVSCADRQSEESASPRIINIVNFIRQTDYRLENADARMFEAVEEQIRLVNEYNFPATFLFQYDALINPQYQELIKTQLNACCEIGAWWEITQPHVEAAGLEWRGDHSWVSEAHIAFATGYTPEERERLVDVYMEKFHEIYGFYPQSAGSWFIDAHTLSYMYEKYGIVASCNCKDQIGTDGYTLWGGYWNQAYYPSRKNAYMPAQTKDGQIPVPVFRMLGSDPIYQYDTGVGRGCQGVISLEPVYDESGKNRAWVDYFLASMADQPCLAFSYVQAGQENSFTWDAMKEGLLMQFPLFDELRKQGKIRIETLAESGRWFKEQFPLTPSTAVVAMDDLRDEGRKTVWYNSRYYRANLLWEQGAFRFRDIHLFDEGLESRYLNTPGTDGQAVYETLAVVDGYAWSTEDERAGLRIMQVLGDGPKAEMVLLSPQVQEVSPGVLEVHGKDMGGSVFDIRFDEDHISVTCMTCPENFSWVLELTVSSQTAFWPFESHTDSTIQASHDLYPYTIACRKGKVEWGGEGAGYVFRLVPEQNQVVINCRQ